MLKNIQNGIFILVLFLCIPILGNAQSWRNHLPVQRMKVKQNGMYPTLSKGQIFLVKSGPLFTKSEIDYGQVVVFNKKHNDQDIIYVWRIIGMPGDTVITENEMVSVNGNQLLRRLDKTESSGNIFFETVGKKTYKISLAGQPSDYNRQKVKVPPGFLFLMGDNRNHSADSRFMGIIPIDSVFGVVVSLKESNSTN